ncbi:MAG: tRNA epoxyqueuosine(34) reductase QueG [Thermostichales cyanobacterium BF4_bins_65]
MLPPSNPTPTTTTEQTTEQIKTWARTYGFQKVGIASLEAPPDLSCLDTWWQQGYGADMTWMQDPRRRDPRRIFPAARSLILVALNYYTPHQHSQDPQVGKISRYAWGRDYHRVLGSKLKALCRQLERHYPGSQNRWYVDTGPVAEKIWAQWAGLGWIGKHSLLLTRDYGSWLFLGVVVTSLVLAPDRPHLGHCGTCSRCLEACPTQAIVAPGVVDSRRCIAYHTLENHGETLPGDLDTAGWVAGCDICQEVCPWNQRFAQPSPEPDFAPYPDNHAPRLQELACLSAEEFDRRFPASALRRLKVTRLRRNARHALARLSQSAAAAPDSYTKPGETPPGQNPATKSA